MRRIGLAVVLALSLVLASLGVNGQQGVGQRHRVGLLNGAALGIESVLRESLRALGYVEGTNFVIDARAAQGHVERLPTLMHELLDAKPEVIVTFGTTAAQAAKAATTTTPIVMAFAGGLVSSLAKPGGNVTGMSLAAPGTRIHDGVRRRSALPSAYPGSAAANECLLRRNSKQRPLGWKPNGRHNGAIFLGRVDRFEPQDSGL